MKKTKVIATSLLAIACSSSLIAGATYALFTDSASVNVAITSGKVDVEASVTDITTYSAKADEQGDLVDENNAKYSYEQQPAGKFVNGGTASLVGNQLTLTNITPGDSVRFNLKIENKSNVNILYRMLIGNSEGPLLFSNLDFTIDFDGAGEESEDPVSFSQVKGYKSAWTALAASTEFTSTSLPVEISLPINAGNVYQQSSTSIYIAIEAVQGNAAIGENVEEYESVYFATPETAQDILDGKKGLLSNSTVYFTAGNYPALNISRTTKYLDGAMTYACGDHGTFTTAEAFIEHMNTSGYHVTPTYKRSMENVEFIGLGEVNIAGVNASTGHANGKGATDYVRDITLTSAGSLYYNVNNYKNISFENINFTGKSNIETSHAESTFDGLTFKNCTFTTNGTASGNGPAIRYYNENNNGKFKNLIVKNCEFVNCYQGIYTAQINGITVTESTFDTTGHNALGLQTGGSYIVNYGEVIITGNTFKNIGDRVIRFGNIGAGSVITIKDNTSVNSGDDGGEVIKYVSSESGVEYKVSGNTWGVREGTTLTFPQSVFENQTNN